ncbi:MAG: hypothetical protein IKP83_02385 [Bacteroidales bacterium]|nr:hypothetical protein [Bacteroidales bacterium]
MKAHRFIAGALLAAALLTACKGERCETPFGEGATIDLTQAEFNNLYNNPGGTLVLNRGHRGILVRCAALGSYAAFECACPNDHDVTMLPDDEHFAIRLTCPVCGSSFDVVYGNPIEGSVTPCPLYQYGTSFDGQMLNIY